MGGSDHRKRAQRIGQTCLCFAAQRAARTLARRFDEAFRSEGITNGQFSTMVALSGGANRTPSELADLLGMDRATLSVALGPLKRRGLVEVTRDPHDGRRRRVVLTADGLQILERLLPIWIAEHDALEASIEEATSLSPDTLRRSLQALASEE